MIDDIIKTNQLDSALLLVISKSYVSVKNSSFSGTNVADIMTHLYFRVQEQLSKFKSPEVRILKYLLTLDDPLKAHAEMIRALYLGPNFETKTHEHLSTTSDKLIRMIDAVLNIHKKKSKNNCFFQGNQ